MGINLLRFKKKIKQDGGKRGRSNNNNNDLLNNFLKHHNTGKKGSETPTTTTTTTSTSSPPNKYTMDVPVNINVEKRDNNNINRRARLVQTKTNQVSTFSLLSMPSLQLAAAVANNTRAANDHADDLTQDNTTYNPYLWEYDQDDVYNNYDINQEIEIQFEKQEEDETGHDHQQRDEPGNYNQYYSFDDVGIEEDHHSFFASNPLPGITTTLTTSIDPYNKNNIRINNNHNQITTTNTTSSTSNRRRNLLPPALAAAPPSPPSLQPPFDPTTALGGVVVVPPNIITDLPAGDPTYATPDVTRDLVKRFISDIWNSCNYDMISEICSSNIRINAKDGESFTKVGHVGFANMVRDIHNAFHNYHVEIHSMVCEGNKAFCRLRFSGKHVGRLMGYNASGCLLSWMGATEFTCLNGQIAKVWELIDVASLEEQLLIHHQEQEQEQQQQENYYDNKMMMTTTMFPPSQQQQQQQLVAEAMAMAEQQQQQQQSVGEGIFVPYHHQDIEWDGHHHHHHHVFRHNNNNNTKAEV